MFAVTEKNAPVTMARPRAGNRAFLAAVALTALAVVHALVVGRHSFVGSFDDDANYILVARALAHGHGLTSNLSAGYPLISTYAPGYPALLAPLAWLSGTAFTAFRALSLVLLLVLFPLVWIYLGRRGMSDLLRLGVLGLLALNPVLATFATMVMAELAFMVLLIVLLLLVERWEADPRTFTWTGVGVVVAAAGLLWLKEAGIGLILGLALWFVVRKLWGRAVVTALGTAVLVSPVLIARTIVGSPLIGSRYSDEFGGAFAGGLLHQIKSVIPHAISTYVNVALPRSIAPPHGSPWSTSGALYIVLGVLAWTVSPLIALGFVIAARQLRDAACVMIPVYLASTLFYPFVNERRVLLVLPVVVAWYLLGVGALIKVAGRVGRAAPIPGAAGWAPLLAAVVILIPQFGRDYLYALGQDTSRPLGSPYMALLGRLGTPLEVVETDYLWTTNLATGHRTSDGAYLTAVDDCTPADLRAGLQQDQAVYFLSAALTNNGVGSPCLLAAVEAMPGAVRLLRTASDDASLFELVGRGTPQPLLADLVVGARLAGPGLGTVPVAPQATGDVGGTYATARPQGGAATVVWTWSRPASISQVTVGAVGALTGDGTAAAGAAPAVGSGLALAADGVGPVAVALRAPNGTWYPVATSAGAVGDAGSTPFLLASLVPGFQATAVRVTVTAGVTVAIGDVHVLGQAGG